MAALLLIGAAVPVQAADASDTGLSLTIDYGDDTYSGSTVVTPGTSYTARLQYSVPKLTPGQQATIEVPEGVTVPAGALVVPAGNTVVESLALDGDGNVVVTFKDPLDQTIDQGILSFSFEFDTPADGTSYETVTWSLESEDTTLTIIVKEPGDELKPTLTESAGKAAASGALSSYVSVDDDAVVTVDPAISTIAIGYTLTVTSDVARTGVEISDTIDSWLDYDPASFSATVTTWDADGFNKTTQAYALPAPTIAGDTFMLSGLDLPEQSIVEITYNASVDAAHVSDLEAALQTKVDALDRETGGGFSVLLRNDALVDGDPVFAFATVAGYLPPEPAPNLGAAFAKSDDLATRLEIALDDATGDLDSPVDVTYSFRADLTQWTDFVGTKHELVRNVVLTDTLPTGLEWASGSFVTASGITLVEADATCVAAADMSDDACVGQYSLSADGRTLSVNVGKDITGYYTIDAQAQIVSLASMSTTEEPSQYPQVQTLYGFRNYAYFTYSDSKDPYSRSVYGSVVLPKAPGSTIADSSEFSKTVADDVTVRPGETASVTYDLTLAAGAVEDLRASQIIDEVDTSVFDVTDLDAIKASLSGTYNGASGLSGSDFDLALVNDELVFTTSATFGDSLAGSPDLSGPLDRSVSLTLTLTTLPINGKQELEITNSARVEGETYREYTWTSSATGEATSFGDELEVSKVLYSGAGQWTRNLRGELDDDGALVDNTVVYRIELIPHGDYSGVSIIPLDDVLPEGMSFVGFVDEANLDSETTTGNLSWDMGGNIRATWNAASRTIEIRQISGTTLPSGATATVNFVVQVDDYSEDLGITNSVGNASATVTPSDGFPLMVYKVDSTRPDMVITDRDARFTVTAPGGEVLTTEAYVVDGRLMVDDGDGNDTGLVVPVDPSDPDAIPAGDYTITETVAPEGYALADAPVVATIDATGGSDPVTLYNEPLPLLAIGDLVWVDENANGVQDGGEAVLEGVGVELLDDATGDVLASTVTDTDGRYLFDLLEPGDYRVRFTLTDEQAELWTLVDPDSGADDGVDSDAVRATSETGTISLSETSLGLVSAASYAFAEVQALLGIDPTWDAGVVTRPGNVSVGDLLWLDLDGDGMQDSGEPGIPGVVLVLTGPDGGQVTDVDGRLVGTQTTDSKGHYLFTGLPVLAADESYTVSIDREASFAILKQYLPTVAAAVERALDSSMWAVASQGLVLAGEDDLTLDFGFVMIPEPEVTETSALAETGVESGPWLLATGALLALGAGLLVGRRRLLG